MDSNPEPRFLGYGAFETTAFLTSILVAGYSLISNPKGRQGASDQSEYQVYAGWRLAVVAITAHVVLMVLVIATISLQRGIDTRTVLWVAALMLAPWAPLAGRVRQTLSSAMRVRRMMRMRVTRNELAAVMRDRFKFGQRGIALPVIVYHAEQKLPHQPIEALRENERLAPHEDVLRRLAEEAAQTDSTAGHALELGSMWAMNQGMQPSAIPRYEYIAWRVMSVLDILARVWTVQAFKLRVDPMPEVTGPRDRARVLDIADVLQTGGTISDALVARGMGDRYCDRCKLATRGAVESFLESSERGHTDLRAKEWLRGVGTDWRGRFERIIDVMWEACFMEASADRVDYDEEDPSPSFGDRSKVTTVKIIALIWLVIRSIVHSDGEHQAYADVAKIVREGPYTRNWWDRFWNELAHKMGDTVQLRSEQVENGTAAKFKATLRKLIDDDMHEIVNIFVHNPIDKELCGDKNCSLSDAKLILKMYS